MANIRDVAAASGFSIATVSIVLNDAPQAQLIPEKTKRHIREIAEQLEYYPNSFAQSLRKRRSRMIAVIVFDITDPYCTQILRGVADTLEPRRYGTFIVDIQNDRTRYKRTVSRLLSGQVDGLITVANSTYIELNLFEVFKQRKIPTVMIGRDCGDNLSFVAVDNTEAARSGLEHLYALGHRRIAFIRGPKMLVDSMKRWDGISSFARDTGIRVNPKLVVDLCRPSPTFDEGQQLTDKLIERRRRFTALMAFDDVTAFGAVRALTRAGLKVPDDCSVLGFDDIPAAAFCNPPLTTLRQPVEQMGSLAATAILDHLRMGKNQQGIPQIQQWMTATLVVRDSTKAPSH